MKPRAPRTQRPGDVRTVRRWISVVLITIVVVLVLAAMATVAATTRRNATSAADDTVQRIGERTADLVEGHLRSASAAITQLAAITDHQLLTARDSELERLLASQLVASPQLSGAFVGFPDGSFRFVQRDRDQLILRRIDGSTGAATDSTLADDLAVATTSAVETDYDPRERPWYADAERADDATWTAPYVFFRSHQPGVTLARAVRGADGSTSAVFGVDVSLAELRRFLDDLPIDEGAEAFITAGDTVVAAPASHALSGDADIDELPTIDRIGLSIGDLRLLVGQDEPIDLGDQRRVHLIELDGDGAPQWSVVIRTERLGLVAGLDQRARVALLAIALAGVAFVLATPLLTRLLRRPIEELSRQARIDSLTDISNRQAFLVDAGEALERARRLDCELTVAVLDIDDFKLVNDRLGHQAGDEVLQRAGEILRTSTRPHDVVGRLGGDEFAIVLADLDRRRAHAVLERVRGRLAAEAPESPSVRTTVGVTTLAGRHLGLEALLAEADQQLIATKRVAKDTISWVPRRRGTDREPMRLA